MQRLRTIHPVLSILVMVFLLGHAHMGIIDTRGAYTAMRTGDVNDGWAREHHALWLDDVEAAKILSQRSAPTGAHSPVGDSPAQA